MTTLKIEDAVRDRLRTLAKRHGRTMGEQVAALVEQAEQIEMWDGYRAAIASLGPQTAALIDSHAAVALADATDRHGRAGTW